MTQAYLVLENERVSEAPPGYPGAVPVRVSVRTDPRYPGSALALSREYAKTDRRHLLSMRKDNDGYAVVYELPDGPERDARIFDYEQKKAARDARDRAHRGARAKIDLAMLTLAVLFLRGLSLADPMALTAEESEAADRILESKLNG